MIFTCVLLQEGGKDGSTNSEERHEKADSEKSEKKDVEKGLRDEAKEKRDKGKGDEPDAEDAVWTLEEKDQLFQFITKVTQTLRVWKRMTC